MVTTVTDNSPQSINTSLFSLDRDIQEVKKIAESFDEKLSGINTEAGVISVNGKQGIVELDASDVKALPDTTVIPTTTSELTNDSGFITSSDSITGNAATATKATQDGNGNVITSTYAKKSEVNDLIDDSKTDSAHTWSSKKIENRLTSKRVFPLYVDNDCKVSDLFYFAMKNPDGWIDISLSKMTLRSTSIHNGDIMFKHKLGNYIKQMFPSGDPYRITGSIDRFSYRQNTGFDIDFSGLARTYFADGVSTASSSGFDDVAGVFGINFRVYAPDYED